MEVLYYQLFIFVSLVILRMFGGKTLLIGAIGWSILTIANLFFPPLILIQLAVVWGTYAMIAPKRQDKKLAAPLSNASATAPLSAPTATSTNRPFRSVKLGERSTDSGEALPTHFSPRPTPKRPAIKDGVVAKRQAMLNLELAFVDLFFERAKAEVEKQRFEMTADPQTKQIYADKRSKLAFEKNLIQTPPKTPRYEDFVFDHNEDLPSIESTHSSSMRLAWMEVYRGS